MITETGIREQEAAAAKQWNIICYVSAKFIPRDHRANIVELYRFMYLIDSFVDADTPDQAGFERLCQAWKTAKAAPDKRFKKTTAADDQVVATVQNIAWIAEAHGFRSHWVDTYLKCRADDLYNRRTYKTLDDIRQYLHGTGEIFAMMVCKAMHLDPVTYPAACIQARGMQYLSLIRDIPKHNKLGRSYIPREEIEKFGLPDLELETVLANREAFKKCIQKQLERCAAWQASAKEDIAYLPKICKVSLLTAIEMYDWTAATIARDPFVIYDHEVKPTQERVLMAGMRNMLQIQQGS